MHSTLTVTSSTHRSRRVRTTNTGMRFSAIEIAVLALFVAALVAAAVLPSLTRQAAVPSETITIKVGESDTLWEIAAAHPIHGLTTVEAVGAIRDLNGMTGGGVTVGQLLVIPAGEQVVSAMIEGQ